MRTILLQFCIRRRLFWSFAGHHLYCKFYFSIKSLCLYMCGGPGCEHICHSDDYKMELSQIQKHIPIVSGRILLVCGWEVIIKSSALLYLIDYIAMWTDLMSSCARRRNEFYFALLNLPIFVWSRQILPVFARNCLWVCFCYFQYVQLSQRTPRCHREYYSIRTVFASSVSE